MKRIIAMAVILSLVLISTPVFAAKGQRGASSKAMEKASDEAVFHRVGDWFATVGKPDTEKKAILTERKAKRAAEKKQKAIEKNKKEAEKTAEKKKRELEKKAQIKQKEIRRKTDEMKKNMRKK